MRGARCLAGWVLCLADATAQSAQPQREELGAKVRASFLASDRIYGARRVWHDLLADGASCGLHRIERLMPLQALKARPRWRRLPPDLGERQVAAVAPNVLDRTFGRPRPTANGSLTSPMCGRRRVGSMWRPSSICSPGAWWAGR